MDDAECRRLAEACRVARLATTRADGRVDLVPIVFAFAGEALAVAVDHKPKSTQRLQRLANIAANPNVTVLFDHYDEDWTQLWWVRLRGTAAEVTGEEAEAALDALQAKYEQYQELRPAGPVMTIATVELSGWTGTNS